MSGFLKVNTAPADLLEAFFGCPPDAALGLVAGATAAYFGFAQGRLGPEAPPAPSGSATAPKPALKPGHALIRTQKVSLCGSDVWTVYYDLPEKYPFPPGTSAHEPPLKLVQNSSV